LRALRDPYGLTAFFWVHFETAAPLVALDLSRNRAQPHI
jgi:hypothetical protein